MSDQGSDFRIHKLSSIEVGGLALNNHIPQDGSLLLDRDFAWAAFDACGLPTAILVARPALFFHTLVGRRTDWMTARRLMERAQGWMDNQQHIKTALFQVAPGNATMGRLAERLGGVADPGQLWRVDI